LKQQRHRWGHTPPQLHLQVLVLVDGLIARLDGARGGIRAQHCKHREPGQHRARPASGGTISREGCGLCALSWCSSDSTWLFALMS
jgi:hypothetical protein